MHSGGEIATAAGEVDLNIGSAPRSPGTHVSDLLRAIALRLGFFDDEEPNEIVLALGLAWEEWLSRRHPEWIYHFGEIELDGIIGTPDAFELETETLHEIKLTWKSSTKPIDREWMWWSQAKCYCKMLGVRKACLHAGHVNGDYQGSRAQYFIHRVEFSQQEVDGLWAMVVKEKQYLESGGTSQPSEDYL